MLYRAGPVSCSSLRSGLLHAVINTSVLAPGAAVCAAVSPALGPSLSVTLLLPAPPPLGTQLTLCQ